MYLFFKQNLCFYGKQIFIAIWKMAKGNDKYKTTIEAKRLFMCETVFK